MANIKVAVRVRPISTRELSLTGSEVVVRAEPNEIALTNLKVSSSKAGDSRERTRRYGFDYCFDSSDPEGRNYADQATIYGTLGQSILDAMFAGYNGCLVAYGQSASGKTYTMMGTKEDPGLIPRLCEGILSRVEQESGHERVYRVTVSYLEIYNERVRDLLKPSSTSASGLRVREHPRVGPYVQGLTHHVVRTLGSLMSYVEEGTKARKTAPTLQNPSSSRSHALLTVDLSPETSEAERSGDHPGDTASSPRRQDANPGNGGGSRLHLVDLAGSESAATCGGVHRLKEGANINKSLVALGNVISALAERGSTGSGPGKRYIPYRDSSLTWLLKDALGGNATTIMLATISPASASYNETAHTLRFAQRAQSVVNRPVVNEDPVARLIRDLRAEVARLKFLLSEKEIGSTKVPCCCEARASKDSPTHSEQESPQSSKELKDRKDESERSKNEPRSIEVFPIRRFNSSDSVTTCETGSSGSVRKFSSCEHLRSPDRFAGGYNRARVTEINDEEDEIDEPVFVDIPTLVAVLIKPDDDSLHESSTRIEEICSDEVQEGSIDAHFIEAGNGEYEERAEVNDRNSERGNSTNSYDNVPDVDREIDEISSETASPPIPTGRGKSRGRFGKQSSIDDPSSCNLNVSRKFGSIDGISRSKEPSVGLQRSQTNLEKRSGLTDRGKKLNDIREIDDRGKGRSGKSGIWRAIGNVGSRDHLQRKSSNESDRSLKDWNSGKAAGYGIGRKPSLESLKRKTSKDSSSSSSKEEQILVSSLAADKPLSRKDSFDHETTTASGAKHHTAIQRVKRAEIVAAVTERLYSSRKHTEESNMASNSHVSGTRSPPPEGIDARINTGNTGSSGLTARSRLQEISRRMLLRRRRINVDTQTEETTSTLRLRDAASLTEEPRVVLRDAAVLTDDHADCAVRNASDVADRRLPVLRVKDAATLTDRRPPTNILRCKDAESLTDFDLDFDAYDSGGVRSYAESDHPSSVQVSQRRFRHAEMAVGRRTTRTDSSTNTFLTPATDSAVQTTRPQVTNVDRRETNSAESGGCCSRCCDNLTREAGRRAPASSPEKNVISISFPDMISITIESTSALESRIAAMDSADVPIEEKPRLVFNDKESQTDERVGGEAEESTLTDLAFGSTTQATQADGRVFRIENIFEDPKNKASGHEARREAAARKSVTLRNSLGTCSLIGTRDETGTEMELDGSRAEENHGKRTIPKGGLTRAFVVKRRSCSFSPRRPARRLVRHDLWKNWTVPGEGPPGLVEARTALPSALRRDTGLAPIDHRPSGTSNECTSADKTAKEPTRESSGGAGSSRKTKVAATKDPLEHDHNFTDDSLDDNEDDDAARKSAERASSRDGENHEGPCPPDVVAHTKRKASKSANHATNVESSMDDDPDDTEVELPRRKSAEISIRQPETQARIPGVSSYANGNPEDETNVTTTVSDSVGKKKVSFSDLGETTDVSNVLNRKIVTPEEDPAMALKSIVKRTMKPAVTESLDIVRPNVELEQSVQRRMMESAKSDQASSTKRETRDSDDSKKPFDDKKADFPNRDRSGVERDGGNETARSMPKRNILEEYLNEATTFIRNMNSINEYASATSVPGRSYGQKRRRKRGARRGNDPAANKDSTEPRGCGTRDEPQSGGQNGAIESYDKCLRSIERLEACIGKVGRHNQVLRDRYGIDVESAGAKSSLACPSVDSRTAVAIVGNDLEDRRDELSDIFPVSPSLSSVARRAEDARRFTPRDTQDGQVNVPDDGSNNDANDLERSIFRQLMGAADSTCRYWKTRQRGFFSARSELGSRSPTTYSESRETFRRDGRGGILDFDRVPAVGDYLEDIRGGIESGSDPTKETGNLADSRISSVVCSVVDAERRFRDRLPRENDDPSETKMRREPTILKTRMEYLGLADPTSRACLEERDAHGSKDGSRRIEWTNLRGCGGPLELKYPGSPRAKFLQLLRERRRIVENSRETNARDFANA